MKITSQIIAFGCAVSLLFSSGGVVSAETISANRQLLDYAIFNGNGNINWCGGDHLEVNKARIPIDHAVTCNGTSSLRVNVTDTSSQWSVRLVVRNWMSIDFSKYEPEGNLEFDVKGNAGGETFRIGFADHDGEDLTMVSISNYTTLTDNWQHVAIPLSDLAAANPTVDFRDIALLYLKNDGTTDAQKFWITNLTVTSQRQEPESPAIKVNQVGFQPHAQKYALVSFYPESSAVTDGTPFSVCNAETGIAVYTGTLQLLSELDQRDSGETVLKADFSDLQETGTYSVSVNGFDSSVPFSISNSVYDHAITAAQKYFYYQRQGMALEAPYAGKFARTDLGIDDSAVSFSSGKSGTVAAEKGWFDAGDSGKYVNTGAGAVSALLWAYEQFPQEFPDAALNIPESGNDIPDILDEARWELEWILTMQDAESGGFYPRIQGNAGARAIMDANGCTTDDTACAVAVLAEAASIYQKFDSAFAENCLTAAEQGWKFLQAHPENIPSYEVYVVSDDTPDRLWAAAALYRVSGELSCKTYFEQNYTSLTEKFEDNYAYANAWGNNWLTGCWNYLLCDQTEESVVQWLSSEIDIWRNTLLTTKWENNIWGVPLHKGNYFRGITAEICNMAMGLSMTDKVLNLKDARTLQCAETSLDWILGANPLSISYVSGCGKNSIQTIHSEIYEADEIDQIPDGYLPQGPNYTALKNYCQFAAKCYLDNSNDWVTNEHTIYANAALVYLLAEVSAESEPLAGDVNADGVFSIADGVMLQKWLIGAGTITDGQAGDFDGNQRLNGIDLIFMRRKLLEMK